MARTLEKVGYAPEGQEGEEPAAPLSDEARCSPEMVAAALKPLEGRWKMVIIFRLSATPVLRFSELERSIPEVSQKMLSQQLRELERDGIVQRTIHAQIPPKVEYRLTDLGRALYPTLDALLKWAALRKLPSPPTPESPAET